jgi:predicted phage terminase large subunit-like protein
MTDTKNSEQDWQAIHDWLQPISSEYWVEEPSMKQKLFLRSQDKEVLFGGAAGGGKSSALLMAALQFVDVPGYSAILFRRTFADLNLTGALMDRFKDWMSDFPEVRWNNNTYMATFPSGARVSFGYLNNVNDYLRYKGAEYQFVGMDEVTEIRQSDYSYLFSRLRRPGTGPLSKVPLRMRATTNPAPNWVRQRFIVEGSEKGRIFIPSTMYDNPGIDHESYREMLAELDPIERKRLEFGDWWATSLGSLFKREDFVTVGYEEEDSFPQFNANTVWVRFWDLAGTEPNPSYPDPDWTVGTLAAFHEGQAYIMDIQRCRKSGEGVEKLIQATAIRDGIDIPIRMEEEPGSAGKNLVDQYARYVLAGFDFQGMKATGDKETRARPMASAVANGNVKLLRASWNTDYIDEMSSFPEGEVHDDQVDSSVHAFNYVAGLGGGLRRKIEIIV